jgi:hypothetical protein
MRQIQMVLLLVLVSSTLWAQPPPPVEGDVAAVDDDAEDDDDDDEPPLVLATPQPQARNIRPLVIGGALGAVLGGVAGGAVTFVAFQSAIQRGMAASGCQAEECEGYGLAAFFYTIPVTAVGAGLCAAGGAAIGVGVTHLLTRE